MLEQRGRRSSAAAPTRKARADLGMAQTAQNNSDTTWGKKEKSRGASGINNSSSNTGAVMVTITVAVAVAVRVTVTVTIAVAIAVSLAVAVAI